MHYPLNNLSDLYLGYSRNLYNPAEPDPEWLIRAAEHGRILKAIRADARSAREDRPAPRGIVARLRKPLSRA